MSGVAISEATVAIENSAKYVFKLLPPGRWGVYHGWGWAFILDRVDIPVLLQLMRLVPAAEFASRRI
jgi:hypothetical protein